MVDHHLRLRVLLVPLLLGLAPATHAAPVEPSELSEPSNQFDIVIALDASDSVGAGNWEIVEDEVVALTESLSTDEDVDHLGLIQFGTKAEVALSLSDPQTKDSIADIVSSFEWTGGYTATQEAIEQTVGMFDQQARPGRKKIFVILTDGQPYGPDGPEEVCDFESAIKTRGIQTIIIGIGTGWIDQSGADKLRCLTSSTDDMVDVPSYAELDLPGLVPLR